MNLTNWRVAEEVAKILNLTPKEFEKFKKEKKFEECLANCAKFHMFDEDYFSSQNPNNGRNLRTLKSIWVNKDEHSIVNAWIWERSINNYATNYKSWLWEKLHLTKEEINSISIEELDSRAWKYLNMAIEHINRYIDMIPYELQDQFKSEYFDSLHETWIWQKTVRELLMYHLRLEKEKKMVKAQWMEDADIVRNNTIAQFEIQRLLALAVLYRDREQNHEFQHVKEDESFIKSKLIEIFADKWKPRWVPAIRWLKSWSWLYDYTTTRAYYVTKKPDGNYNISEEKPKVWNFMKMSLDGTQIKWMTDYFLKDPKTIDVRHIMLRAAKDASSSVDKFVMKDFSSFTEILDQKWLIIVLDDYKDAIKLEQVLANELWTKETSWVEKLEFVWKHNHNSSWSYQVKKWIIKLSYKAKDRKSRMKAMREDIMKLEQTIKEIERSLSWNIRISDDIESWLSWSYKLITESDLKNSLIDIEKRTLDLGTWLRIHKDLLSYLSKAIERIKTDIEYLKNRLKNLTYNIEVEVQIFDMINYIKAEVEKDIWFVP